MSPLPIRLAEVSDAEAINRIYNYYALHSTCTYQETEESLSDRQRWLANRDLQTRPVTVADDDGEVVGFASLSPFHRRSAYRYTVETAVYVAHDRHREGIGSILLSDLLVRARAADIRSIVALIDHEQAASVALHGKFGFAHVGTLRSAGFKFGRWLDVEYWQILLPE